MNLIYVCRKLPEHRCEHALFRFQWKPLQTVIQVLLSENDTHKNNTAQCSTCGNVTNVFSNVHII